MQTQLILIEGNPFTGKSTLSEFVALQLGLNGYPAQWVPEGVIWSASQTQPHINRHADALASTAQLAFSRRRKTSCV